MSEPAATNVAAAAAVVPAPEFTILGVKAVKHAAAPMLDFTGTIFYRGEGGKMQIIKVPWECSTRYAMPLATWREMIEHYYSGTGWVALGDDTLESLSRRKAARGLHSFDATVAQLLREAAD